MSTLSELDRPVVEWHYERWNRVITLRPISATQFAHMTTKLADLNQQGTEGDLRFYAELLSLALLDPKCSVEEWLAEGTASTVIELGNQAARVCGLLPDEAKKN